MSASVAGFLAKILKMFLWVKALGDGIMRIERHLERIADGIEEISEDD